MTFTQAQIDEFEQNILDAKGVNTATFGDQSVTFSSHEERLSFLAYMKRNKAAVVSTRYAATDKDL